MGLQIEKFPIDPRTQQIQEDSKYTTDPKRSKEHNRSKKIRRTQQIQEDSKDTTDPKRSKEHNRSKKIPTDRIVQNAATKLRQNKLLL